MIVVYIAHFNDIVDYFGPLLKVIKSIGLKINMQLISGQQAVSILIDLFKLLFKLVLKFVLDTSEFNSLLSSVGVGESLVDGRARVSNGLLIG